MKKDRSMGYITIICVFIGILFAQSFMYMGEEQEIEIGGVTSLKRMDQLSSQKDELEKRKNSLEEEITDMESILIAYEEIAAFENDKFQDIQEEIQNARTMAGLTSLEGPGVEIVLSDRKREDIVTNDSQMLSFFIVHDSDMLNVINELRGAGAEAIAVNDTRIMANSRISCGGPTINVGKYGRFAPPFIIHAIGNPDKIIANFQKPDSIYQDLIAWGLEFSIKKVDKLQIPRYLGDIDYEYAKAVKEGE